MVCLSRRCACAVVFLPSIIMPLLSLSMSLSWIVLSTRAMYVFLMSCFGWVSLLARSPSFVRMMSPSVSLSSLPTGKILSFVWIRFMIVFMPWLSVTVVTYPFGLFRR